MNRHPTNNNGNALAIRKNERTIPGRSVHTHHDMKSKPPPAAAGISIVASSLVAVQIFSGK